MSKHGQWSETMGAEVYQDLEGHRSPIPGLSNGVSLQSSWDREIGMKMELFQEKDVLLMK